MLTQGIFWEKFVAFVMSQRPPSLRIPPVLSQCAARSLPQTPRRSTCASTAPSREATPLSSPRGSVRWRVGAVAFREIPWAGKVS